MLGKPDVPFHKVFKPECNDCWSLSHVHKTTCHIQRVLYEHEPCQHLAGTSVVEKCVGALTDPTDNHNVILDLLGFDGWPASYGLTETAKGNRWAVGTICHTLHETNFVGEICSNKIFSLARESKLKIPGFPNFMSLVEELQKSQCPSTQPEFAVCTPLADGGLVIKTALIELWTVKNEGFKDEAEPWLRFDFFPKINKTSSFVGRLLKPNENLVAIK